MCISCQTVLRTGKTSHIWEHSFSIYLPELGIINFFLTLSTNWATSSSSLNCYFFSYQRNWGFFHVSIRLSVNCLFPISIYLLVYSCSNATFKKLLENYILCLYVHFSFSEFSELILHLLFRLDFRISWTS